VTGARYDGRYGNRVKPRGGRGHRGVADSGGVIGPKMPRCTVRCPLPSKTLAKRGLFALECRYRICLPEQQVTLMPTEKSRLTDRVLEVRYDRGYRYLDRCGEVLLILEDVLTQETGKVWMPEELSPTGARIKCPDLDAAIILDSYHLIVQQVPVDVEFDFQMSCRTIWAVVETRLGLSAISRAGSRRKFTIPTDTLDDAEKLAVKYSPLRDWPVSESAAFKRHNSEATSVFESPDRTVGIRFTVSAEAKLGAPIKIDDRLRLPPHFLQSGQHEALLAQLKRHKDQNKDPDAGLVFDIDYYELFPKQFDMAAFIKRAWTEDERFRDALLSKGNT